MPRGKPWSRDELLIAMNLYCKLPFGQLHHRNPAIQDVAVKLHRTPGSLAMKLVNFASLDPTLVQRGLPGASKADRQIWQEFADDWDKLGEESEIRFQELVENKNFQEEEITEGVTTAKVRLKQQFFRETILNNYNSNCCISSNPIPELLVAGHILPWATYPKHRLDPCNGLCLSQTYEKAFDQGLIALDNDYRLIISSYVKSFLPNSTIERDFIAYCGKQINFPDKFLPNLTFLEIHRNDVFRK
jgi:predicted restriction endonuclease